MLDDIKKIYNNYNPYINGWEDMKIASVVIPIVEENGEYYILFQLRAKHMRTQPGEISFPGGSIDKNETPKEAAIREMCEELGLLENDFEIISPLDILVTPFNLLIHPFLGCIKNYNNIKINKDEVDHVFLVPIKFLINSDPLRVENSVNIIRNPVFPFNLIPQKENYKFKSGIYESIFYIYNDYVIWGITGKITENFIEYLKTNLILNN